MTASFVLVMVNHLMCASWIIFFFSPGAACQFTIPFDEIQRFAQVIGETAFEFIGAHIVFLLER
jgi:hypothetical protein